MKFPKLLLLDEIDAPLHPSMTRDLLDILLNVIIREHNVRVILTTHSPSTVALAPESSIFLLQSRPDGHLLELISKNKAIRSLASGIPTLNVSFDDRRQVFVESYRDAQVYTELYEVCRSELSSQRSLTFIEVGNRDDSGGEQNAGSVQVERIVTALRSGGNTSAWGLLDWDGNRERRDFLQVLSQSYRDGIESLLFDPAILLLTVVHTKREFAILKGLICDSDTLLGIYQKWSHSTWQSVVEKIQALVLGRDANKECLEISYLGGMRLGISKEYLHMDDHALEKKVYTAFPILTPLNKNSRCLLRHIATTIVREFPQMIPSDLIATFNEILEQDK